MAEQIQLDVDLAGIKQQLAEFQKELVKTGSTGSTAFGIISDEVKEATAQMKDIIAVQEDVNAEMKKGEVAVGGFGSKIKASILEARVFGKSIGEWVGQLNGAKAALGAAVQGTFTLSNAFKVLRLAIISTGIGALVIAVVAVITYFTKFQGGIDKISRVMAGLGAVVNVIADRVVAFGTAMVNVASSIYKFFTFDFKGAAADGIAGFNGLKEAVSGVGAEILNAYDAASLLEKRLQDLRDATRTASVEEARLAVQLEKFKRIAEDETISLGKREAARRSAAKIEEQLADAAIDRALEARDIAAGNFALSTKTAADKDEFAKAEIELLDQIDKKNKLVFENEKTGREIQKKGREQSAKALKAEADALAKIQKDLEKLRVEAQPEGIEQELAAVEKKFDDLERLTKDGIAKLGEIEARRGLSPKEQEARKELRELSVQLEQRRMDALLDVVTKYAEKDIEIEQELVKQKEALAKKDYDALVKSLEAEKKLRIQQVDIAEEQAKGFLLRLKEQGASEEEIKKAQIEFDLFSQQARLRAELDFQQKLLAATVDGDPERIAAIKASIEKLKAELGNIDFQIDNPAGDKKPFDLFTLLGLDPDDPGFDAKKAALIKGANNIVDILKNLTAARLEEAQAAVDAADKKIEAAEAAVDKAEEALDREIALAELGFASDVTNKQLELAAAEEAEAQAKLQREKALEDQKRAQKAQLALDTATQATSLVTASAKILAQFAGPLLPIGLLLIAAMFGAFISARARAAQAVKSATAKEGITGHVGKDGIIVGPSHEGGGVPLTVEGKEFVYQDGKRISVVKKRATAAHFGLLQAINNDDRLGMAHYLHKLTGGISRNDTSTAEAAGSSSSRSTVGVSDAKTQQLLAENNRLQAKALKAEENKVQYFDMGAYLLKIEKGGKETRIKKQR